MRERILRSFMSTGPFTELFAVPQVESCEINGRSPRTKPRGLWYQLNNSWRDWMKWNMPEWAEDYSHEYRIEISKERVLRIDSAERFMDFEDEWLVGDAIDWEGLSEEYAGIEISPHRGEFRPEWYDHWDISSGCIWCPKGLDSFELISKGV